jgi:predicted dehydrogenase
VIGAGWVATARHIPSLRRHPEVDVVALYDRRPERAEATARALQVPAHFSELEAFLDQGFDLVCICTPPWTHAELAISALERGIHVFTEKPMAMTEGDARAMAAAADAADRLLCVSHNFLFTRAAQRVTAALGGQPAVHVMGLQLSSHRRRLPEWYAELPGGLLLDESPHMLYTLQHFLGPLELDGARSRMDPATGLPVMTEVRVKSGDATGLVSMVFRSPVSEWHVGVVTEDRFADLDLFRDISVVVGSDAEHKPLDILGTSARAMWDHASGFLSSGARYVSRRMFWGHDVIIGRFVDATLGRGPSPVAVEDSIGVVRLTDALLEQLDLR